MEHSNGERLCWPPTSPWPIFCSSRYSLVLAGRYTYLQYQLNISGFKEPSAPGASLDGLGFPRNGLPPYPVSQAG